MAIKFGTEGWRAVMAEEFTAENVRTVTQATAEHLLERGAGGAALAVGYDTRFLSDRFARVICEVLAANGFRVLLSSGMVPTCAVSRIVVAKKLAAGIMVTASHNPPEYNGFKIKEAYGGSATSDTVASIEARLAGVSVKRRAFEDAVRGGAIATVDLLRPYLAGLRAFLDVPAIRRAPLKVVVDSMHGAGGRLIEGLLAGGRCRVETLRGERDPLFGGQAPEPIASHLAPLQQAVRRRRAGVGLANDGDADRLGIVGPDGTWLNPGQVMCILLQHLIATRRAKGAVVKTVSNTMMINRLASLLGLKLIEVPVGFKHIVKLMLEQDVLIGGEESGGIGVKGYLPERDGILNGLLLLEAMAMSRTPLPALLRALEQQCGRWFYGRQDLHLDFGRVDRLFDRLLREPPERLGPVRVASVNRLDGVKLIGADESWLLFRRSGTEPIVRIYAETSVRARLRPLLKFGVGLATKD
jgi:phosphomannomutase